MKKILLAIIFFCLSGCMNAALTGAQALYNRHNLQHSFNDHYTTLSIERALYLHQGQFENTHILVTTLNNEVLLTGQVPSRDLRQKAENIAKEMTDAKIYNFITVATPTSELVRLNDMWITTKIKSQLFANNDIDPSQIKVITEDGTVYLLGTVPHDEADIAVEIARSTRGVERVINMFSYVRISRT